MPVTFTKKKSASNGGFTSESPFSRWYKKNREEFNRQRRNRYKTDPEYRKKMQEASRRTRSNHGPGEGRPEQYVVSLAQAAEILDVTIWTIRNWRRQEYFPEPYIDREGMWFTEPQLALLKGLHAYFVSNGIKRLTAAQRVEVGRISSEIYQHWRT